MKEEKGFFSEYKEQFKEALTDLKTKGRRYRQIPNILTLLRLTAPLVILPAAVTGNIPFIVGATAFFGLTDLADGQIARRCNLTSKLGAELDALADKLFAGTLLLAASVANPALLINVGLEMGIAGINIYQKAKGKETGSTMMGKVKTFALFPLAGAGILSSVLPPAVLTTLAVTTTGLQGMTIASYLAKYKTDKPNNPGNGEYIDTPEVKVESKPEEEKEKQKEKAIEPNQITSTQKQENPEVKRLRDMRDFLIHEKDLSVVKPVVEEVKVYRK